MGSETTVYGVIVTDPQFSDEDSETLTRFQFDEKYPFPNMYGPMQRGYLSCSIPFGRVFKSLIEELGEWELRFESLLSTLHCRTASVRFDDEIHGELSLEYVCVDGWLRDVAPSKRSWRKWRNGSEADWVGPVD
ncbi:MAG: hypothetical protein R3C18_20895 [Planctomycetaceae bacterium]